MCANSARRKLIGILINEIFLVQMWKGKCVCVRVQVKEVEWSKYIYVCMYIWKFSDMYIFIYYVYSYTYTCTYTYIYDMIVIGFIIYRQAHRLFLFPYSIDCISNFWLACLMTLNDFNGIYVYTYIHFKEYIKRTLYIYCEWKAKKYSGCHIFLLLVFLLLFVFVEFCKSSY